MEPRDDTPADEPLDHDGADAAQGTVRIEASDDAAEFIRDRGGCVYIWVDSAGFSRTSPKPPDREIDWLRFDGDGFEVFQDPDIVSPRFWRLLRRRFPARVAALWNGEEPVHGT